MPHGYRAPLGYAKKDSLGGISSEFRRLLTDIVRLCTSPLRRTSRNSHEFRVMKIHHGAARWAKNGLSQEINPEHAIAILESRFVNFSPLAA